MRINSRVLFLAGLLVFVFFHFSCSHEDKPTPEPEIKVVTEELPGLKPVIVDNVTEIRYPTDFAEEQETFDWENLEYLPLPPNHKPIPMPWSSQANRQFSDDIRNDYKKADGWELYLSTFSPKFFQGNLTFSLYNKYRGILRYYFFMGYDTQKFRDYHILYNNAFSSD